MARDGIHCSAPRMDWSIIVIVIIVVIVMFVWAVNRERRK
jgi:hypothetical protein